MRVEELFNALRARDVAQASKLLSEGVDVNAQTSIGEGVWSFVIPEGREAVKLALNCGADPNSIDAAGRNALYWAIMADESDVIKMLLDHGANVEYSTSLGYGLLHDAASWGKSQALVALLPIVTDQMLLAEDVEGLTPLQEALRGKFTTCAEAVRDEMRRRGLHEK